MRVQLFTCERKKCLFFQNFIVFSFDKGSKLFFHHRNLRRLQTYSTKRRLFVSAAKLERVWGNTKTEFDNKKTINLKYPLCQTNFYTDQELQIYIWYIHGCVSLVL